MVTLIAFLVLMLESIDAMLMTRTFTGSWDFIWSDAGSGADDDFSTWKQNLNGWDGWYRPGHFVGNVGSVRKRESSLDWTEIRI